MKIYGNAAEKRPELTKQSSIWRYRPIDRFVEELKNGETYLRRIDKLDDQFEGVLLKQEASALASLTGGAISQDENQQERQRTYIQCWQISDHEDVAMWDRYVGEAGGVAIATNVQKLRDHYYVHSRSSDRMDAYIRATFVDYVDADNHFDFLEALGEEKFLRKRREFSGEREFRVIYRLTPKFPNGDGTSTIDHNFHYADGVSLAIEHASMIEKVIMSPGLAEQAEGEVLGVLSKIGIERRLSRSIMDAKLPI